MMKVRRGLALLWVVASSFAVTSRAAGQVVSLPGLWPHQNGRTWQFDATVTFYPTRPQSFRAALLLDGEGAVGGVTAQNLRGTVNGVSVSGPAQGAAVAPIPATLWRARPELRQKLSALVTSSTEAPDWPFDLLGPAALSDGHGFLETGDAVGVWRDTIGGWGWKWLTSDLDVGAQFILQLIPDLADDVYLFGHVDELKQMALPWGLVYDVVVMSYVVDYGTGILFDAHGTPIGTVHAQTQGSITFAMGEGPVEEHEQLVVLESDCPGGCPLDAAPGTVWKEGGLTLGARSVRLDSSSWGACKAAYGPTSSAPPGRD